jgi:uncharacterized repeat protein (TIGR01451 family)
MKVHHWALKLRALRRSLLATAGVSAIAVALGGAAVAAPGVTPSTVTDTLLPGASKTISKSVETSPIPPNPDIFFLADTTGSMGGAVANVRTGNANVMATVLTAQPTAEFGVGEYKDTTDAFAYRLNQAITANTADVQTGMNAWVAGGGGDTPECQLNALHEVATSGATGFRSGSSRIVVWFGDAVGHDPCNGATEASATADLVAAGIRVIAISTGAANNLNGTGQAQRIANATGGVFLSGASDSQVSDAILNGLSNLPVTVTPSVSCDAGVSASVTPASQTAVSGTTFTFSETYGVNAGTLAGTYNCTVKFLLNGLDGGPAFQESITINVPAPDLSMAKTGPALVTEGHNATYTLTATNLGPTTATGVTVTDPVPANSTFVSASAGCAQAAGLITCTAGTLAPSGSQAFTITLLAGSGASIVNIATVAGDQTDPNPANNKATVTTTINHNPVCTAATTGLGTLWPPNHKYVAGQIAGVTDPDGNPITLTITGITQDEPVNSAADGDTSPDATIGSGGAFKVRSERSGQGDGRVYRVAFTATDGLGGECSGVGRIGVPHDQGGQPAPIDSAPPSYDSTLP